MTRCVPHQAVCARGEVAELVGEEAMIGREAGKEDEPRQLVGPSPGSSKEEFRPAYRCGDVGATIAD